MHNLFKKLLPEQQPDLNDNLIIRLFFSIATPIQTGEGYDTG
jgi:hypothetical protein